MVMNSVVAYRLYFNDGIKTWFLPYIGLLLIPLVLIQLVSAILFLSKNGDKLSVTSCILVASLHVFQLGLIWRHFTTFRQVVPKCRSRELADFNILQNVHLFTSMLPLLCIQTFLFYHHEIGDIVLLATIAITLFGICWDLSTLGSTENDVMGVQSMICVRILVKFLWRIGELVSRVISLTIFASVYHYWIFLIVGLHGITMLVCLCTSIMGVFDTRGVSRSHKVYLSLMFSYMYSFCFINITSHSSAFKYALFYIIMFFENVVLTVVWYLQVEKSHVYINKNLVAALSAGFFIISMIFLVIYYKAFRLKHARDDESDLINEKYSCINCKLSMCSKHNLKLQRPFSAGWMSQYQKALATGNYYKNILHDTLLDSDRESAHDILNSSGEHCQIRDTDLESIRNSERKYTSVQGTGTYTHKRFFDSDPNIRQSAETDSISGGSAIYDDDWRHKPDALLSQLTAQDTLSLLSSKTKLLTDSWDDLKKESVSLDKDPKHPKSLDVLNSLIKKDLDSSFLSDGYTTDYTLESYQLPVTVLAKRRARLFKRQAEPTYSVTSDSTDCTICSFIRNNPSSPESSRRKFSIHEDIPEETYAEVQKRCRNVRKERQTTYKKYRAKSADSNRRSNKPCREVINLNDIYSKPKRKTERTVKVDVEGRQKPQNKTLSKIPIPTSTKHKSNLHQVPSVAKANSIPEKNDMTGKERVLNNLQKYNVTKMPHKPRDLVFVSRVKETAPSYASDSGDSAFPRNTPLSSYLAATDDYQDGISDSSGEMII